ncbi:MAG: VTT domain-containing protein [Xanthomonadales bacterium]|nr:VTT domain-containing protein [Xanthomonadales bacterium]
MDAHWTQALLDWLRDNPGWGFVTMLVIAMVESLVLIGFFIPGIIILFGFGMLIGFGVLELAPLWLAGSLGAVLGDGLSYWLGYHYREKLAGAWPFSRYPELLERGRLFFRRHGGKGIIAGRFIGPIRPFVPVAVGMLRFPPRRFALFAIPAAIAWTPFYLLPGMVFGASLEVVAEYAGRLALLMVAAVGILWLTWWGITEAYAFVVRRSARWLRRAIQWSRRHPVMGRVTRALLDPNQPEVLSVTMLGLVLVLIMVALVALLFLSPFSAQPQALDAWVQQQASGLRNEAADPWLVAVSQLARWGTLVPPAAAALFWLLGAGRRKAAWHWLAAILGGMALQFILGWALRSVPVTEPDMIRGPSAAMTLTTVTLGFFAVLVARELRRRRRKWPYLIAALLTAALGFARIYLGLDWLSGALMGVFMGLAWAAVTRSWRTPFGFAPAIAAGALLALFVPDGPRFF